MIVEAVVTGSPGEIFRVGLTILASFSESVICEVTISGTRGETTELVSAPWLAAIECVVYNSLRETLGVVLETVGLVSGGWVINGTTVSGSPG